MQRYLIASLLILAGVSTPISINAEPATSTKAIVNQAGSTQLTPYQLVFSAYQGLFRQSGIPGASVLANDYQWQRMSAKNLVERAVQANLLPPSVLEDKGYINAVDANLAALKSNSRGG